MYCLFSVGLCIVCVYMCTVLLPPGGYPIAVNRYIISYHIISYHIISYIISESLHQDFIETFNNTCLAICFIETMVLAP